MTRTSKVTQQQIDFMIKSTAAGATQRQIAEELGLAQPTIMRYLRKYKAIRTKKPKFDFNTI